MREQIKNAIGVVGIVLGIVLILLIAVEVSNRTKGGYDLSKTRSISMSAEGKVSARPDLAVLSFAVVSQGKDPEKVQSDNDAKMTAVIGYLKDNGVNADDIQTSGYNLYPQYDYSQPQATQEIIGYNLTQNVTAKVRKLETVSAIVGGLTGKGVNQINSVAYTIDDPDKLKEEARGQAIDKAKQKANELADQIGVRLGKVINFTEGGGVVPQPYYDKLSPSLPFGGEASPVEPGTQDVTVNVTLTFELK